MQKGNNRQLKHHKFTFLLMLFMASSFLVVGLLLLFKQSVNADEVNGYTITYHTKPAKSDSYIIDTKDYGEDKLADYGDTLTINVSGGSSKPMLLIYSEDEKRPTVNKVEDEDKIDDLNASVEKVLYCNNKVAVVNLDDDPYFYVCVKEKWYYFDKSFKVAMVEDFEEVIDDSIIDNSYVRYFLLGITEDEIEALATYFRLSRVIRRSTPLANISINNTPLTEGVMTAVDMNAKVKIKLPTYSGKGKVTYFYTVDSSSPSYSITNGVPVSTSSSTKKIDGSSVELTVTPSIADFEQQFNISLLGVIYDANGKKIMTDTRKIFDLKVNSKVDIPEITSFPETLDQQPVEVKKGNVIQLYAGKYEAPSTSGNTLPTPEIDQTNYTIYYTIDGTEPSVNNSGVMQGTTKQYTSSGIIVPKAEDSRFIISAIATDNKYSYGNLYTFIYQYPNSVAQPYANPAEGSVAENTQIELKCSTPEAKIYYTVGKNGEEPTEPTTSDTLFSADSPIIITEETKIKAMATFDNVDSKVSNFHYTVSTKLSMPTASIASGAIVPSGTTLTLSSQEGGTIHYTTDGSNPMDSSNTNVVIGNTVPLNGDIGTTIMVKAYVTKDDYTSSAIGIFSYTISNYAGGIYADKAEGSTIKNGDFVTLNTDVTDATIYYTTDGSNPTTASSSGNKATISGEPGAKVVLKAIAVSNGSTRTTAAATFSYQIMGKLKSPNSSIPNGAIFTSESQIVLTAEEGSIYYTLNNEEPTAGSTLYEAPIEIKKDMIVKAIAIGENMDNSEISTFQYTMAEQVQTPIASLESGEVELGTILTFSCETPDAILYYTTNGADPNTKEKESLNVYTDGIAIDRAMTIKIIGTKQNCKDSTITTIGFTVKEPVVYETKEEETATYTQDTGNRLMSRNTYANANAGPSHSDFIIKNLNYGAVLSSEKDVLPVGTQLMLEKVQVADSTVKLVKQMVNDSYDIVASYDVSLLLDNEPVEIDGEAEIGIPVPSEYENAIIKIVQISEDGMVKVYETRRSNGIAYADINSIGIYSIIAPLDFEEEQQGLPLQNVILIIAGTLIAGGTVIYILYRKKKIANQNIVSREEK